MTRRTIVFSAAFLLAVSATTSVKASEPAPRLWETWCVWLDSLGVPRSGPPPELSREELRRLVAPPEPVMPVDYSYDDIVDQP